MALPPGLTPGLDPLTSPTGEIYKYTLESDTKGLRELSEIQRWTVIPALKQVPGVADVDEFRRHHHAVPARARSAAAHAFQPVAQERHRRHQRQQRQFRRQRPRRAASSATSSAASAWSRRSTTWATSSSPSATARRSSCAISASSSSATRSATASSARTTSNDAIEGTVLLLRGENPSRVHGGRARQGRRAQRAPEGRRRADRALSRPLEPGRRDGRQGLAHGLPGHRPGSDRPHPVSRQPAQRLDRRHHHPVRDGGGFHPDESHQDSRRTCCRSAPSISASSSTARS